MMTPGLHLLVERLMTRGRYSEPELLSGCDLLEMYVIPPRVSGFGGSNHLYARSE
jgi:hypothetical protein